MLNEAIRSRLKPRPRSRQSTLDTSLVSRP